MCDSPILRSEYIQTLPTSKFLFSRGTYNNSKVQSDLLDELQSVSSSLKASNFFGANRNSGSSTRGNHYPRRLQLEQDVQRLQLQLQEELEIRSILENAIENNVFTLSCETSLPAEAQDLLSTMSVLEVTVSKLEQQIISLHFQLSQERNERKLAEYRVRQSANHSMSASSSERTQSTVLSPSRQLDGSCGVDHSDSEVCNSNEITSMTNDRLESNAEASCTEHLVKGQEKLLAILHEKNTFGKTSMEHGKVVEVKKLPRSIPPKGLWDHPNQLSEEMVRCMKNIFTSLADSAVPSMSSALEGQSSPVSPQGHLSNSSWWSSSEKSLVSSWVQSPQVDVQSNAEVLAAENVFDPYRVRGKLSWAEIGNYSLATEVSWMSVGKKQLEYASGALRRFRILVELLAKVNPIHLNDDEKLAFWINLYNALLMHAYLAYGVPKSDLKLFSLMQKAAYTVGGCSFSATAIEYVILKMKPPLHRPQIALLLALRKLKVSEEQRKSAVDSCEQLVAFALSCGMYSSPAVKIYTAKNVREELQDAQHDFIRASVGVSNKGKLLVPKMLHCFAKNSVDDSDLAVWISRYLPPQQAAFVEQCVSQRGLSVSSSRNCGILPFDSRFRYLFLPDKTSS